VHNIVQNGAKGRRELKHALTRADCFLLRQRLQHVMKRDSHANQDGKYLIRSVYFDNFDNKVLTEKKEGYYHRDKFRVRLYDFQSGYMNLEKKSKHNNLTYKQKCRLTADEYKRICTGDVDWLAIDKRDLCKELYIHMTIYQVKPITVVDYEREAYVYEYGNVRVTFDSNVRTSFRNNDILNPHLPMVEALDSNVVILEVKYDEYLPDFIKVLLQVSDRRQDAYSKYQLSRMYG